MLNLDPRVPHVIFLDATRVRQVVMNGLTNGAKYGGARVVELNVRETDTGELLFEVLDRGCGLKGRTLADLSAELTFPREKANSTRRRRPSLEPQSAPVAVAAKPPPPGATTTGAEIQSDSAFDNARSTRMGIPICVRLAALMGGSLSLEDRVDGPGACAGRGAAAPHCI